MYVSNNFKSETHHENMHMDEEDTESIAEWEVETSMCEIEKEHIDAWEHHSNMDGEDDGESHFDKTHVDGDCKVSCEWWYWNYIVH